MESLSGHRISEVAARTGFSSSALRFYEGVGLVEPGRTASGYRVYDDRTIDRLRFIGRAKDLGLSLDEIAELLPAWDGDDCGEVAARVAAKVSETRARITELTVLAEDLESARRRLIHDVTDGPCGLSCACTAASETVVGRVPVALGAKPLAPSSTEVPIACTLAPGEMVDRVDDWEQLLARQVGRPVQVVDGAKGSVTVRFPPDPALTRMASELAAQEQTCCGFIDFTLRIDQDGTELTATATLDGLPIVAALLGASA